MEPAARLRRGPGSIAARRPRAARPPARDPVAGSPARARGGRAGSIPSSPTSRLSCLAVDLERLGLPPGSVEREHERATRPSCSGCSGRAPRARGRARPGGRARGRRRCAARARPGGQPRDAAISACESASSARSASGGRARGRGPRARSRRLVRLGVLRVGDQLARSGGGRAAPGRAGSGSRARESRSRCRRAASAAGRRGTGARLPRQRGGSADHSSSISRSTDTTSLGVSRSSTSSARCFDPPSGSGRPRVDDLERSEDPELHRARSHYDQRRSLREASAGPQRARDIAAGVGLPRRRNGRLRRPSTSAPTSSAIGSRS